MLRRAAVPLLVLALVASARTYGAAQGPRLTADAVARRVQDRDTGRDSRQRLRMKLIDRRGRVRERALEVTALRGREAPGAARTAPDGDRLLIRFTYPNDIRGTGFLVWEHPSAEDERFLYLPSLSRVRRIAGSETQDSFVGSDFTYEDISGRELDDFRYTMVEENAVWTAPDGQRVPAYRIESRAKDAQARFPRVVSTIRKDNFVIVHADIHNRRDERQKIYDVRRLDLVQSIWTLAEIVMTNSTEQSRTELLVKSVRYNTGLKEEDFSRRELERK
jgi:hypothetical protein